LQSHYENEVSTAKYEAKTQWWEADQEMKASLVLALVLLLTAGTIAYNTVSGPPVTSAVSHTRAAEPVQMLMCGAALLVMSFAVRRARFAVHRR
jgi:ABC-type enterobactin transport system permease subunit